jgi:hypothetical protein
VCWTFSGYIIASKPHHRCGCISPFQIQRIFINFLVAIVSTIILTNLYFYLLNLFFTQYHQSTSQNFYVQPSTPTITATSFFENSLMDTRNSAWKGIGNAVFIECEELGVGLGLVP